MFSNAVQPLNVGENELEHLRIFQGSHPAMMRSSSRGRGAGRGRWMGRGQPMGAQRGVPYGVANPRFMHNGRSVTAPRRTYGRFRPRGYGYPLRGRALPGYGAFNYYNGFHTQPVVPIQIFPTANHGWMLPSTMDLNHFREAEQLVFSSICGNESVEIASGVVGEYVKNEISSAEKMLALGSYMFGTALRGQVSATRIAAIAVGVQKTIPESPLLQTLCDIGRAESLRSMSVGSVEVWFKLSFTLAELYASFKRADFSTDIRTVIRQILVQLASVLRDTTIVHISHILNICGKEWINENEDEVLSLLGVVETYLQTWTPVPVKQVLFELYKQCIIWAGLVQAEEE